MPLRLSRFESLDQRAGVVRAAAEAGADGSATSAMQEDGASPQGKGRGQGKKARPPQYKLDLGPDDGGMEVVSPLADGLGT